MFPELNPNILVSMTSNASYGGSLTAYPRNYSITYQGATYQGVTYQSGVLDNILTAHGEEGEPVNIKKQRIDESNEYVYYCTDENDLSPERILTTISAIKGRIALDATPDGVLDNECSMTPLVRKRIIEASKKLKMYGKEMPIIARFDEYGNKLPDTIDLQGATGIELKIVDPKYYGELYFSLKSTIVPI